MLHVRVQQGSERRQQDAPRVVDVLQNLSVNRSNATSRNGLGTWREAVTAVRPLRPNGRPGVTPLTVEIREAPTRPEGVKRTGRVQIRGWPAKCTCPPLQPQGPPRPKKLSKSETFFTAALDPGASADTPVRNQGPGAACPDRTQAIPRKVQQSSTSIGAVPAVCPIE